MARPSPHGRMARIQMSRFTAIKRNKPSAPMKWLHTNGYLIGRTLDFGCGRGMDAATYSLEAYDPYWCPDMPTGKFDTITCIYVLNTVPIDKSACIIEQIKDKLEPGGKAYFAVRRDFKKKKKGRGCIQRCVKLNFPSIRKSSTYEIYEYMEDK